MTREILFRGFSPNERGEQIITLDGKDIRGDWVEGTPIFPKEHAEALITTGQIAVPGLPNFGFVQHEVIPETVGQYIKSLPTGEDVFCNSQLKIISTVKCEDGSSCKRTDTAIIRFNEKQCEWELKVSHNGKYKRISRAAYFLNSSDTKVIGTIFDKEKK